MLMLGSQLGIRSPVFLPYLVFGAISCLAGLLVLLLPVSAQRAGFYFGMLAVALLCQQCICGDVQPICSMYMCMRHHCTTWGGYANGGAISSTLLVAACLQETLGAAMPESMADLEQLQSFFAAQPWRQGCWGILSFMFRTRAATAGKPAASATGKIVTNSRPVIVVSGYSSDDAQSDDSVSTGCNGKAHSKPACLAVVRTGDVCLSTAEQCADI
jgi:hypothetical protein